jgi:hypothetical protein
LEVKNMDATSASDMLTVLQNVEQFYETSWNHLVICGSVAVGMVGVVIPILFQWFQTRTLQNERAGLRASVYDRVSREVRDLMLKEKALLDEKIAASIKSLEERLAQDRAKLEEGVRNLEAELRREIARVQGGALHVQANALISDKNYAMAFTSAIEGLGKYMDAEDHYNLRNLLKTLTNACLPNITKAKLDEMEDHKKEFHEVVARIKEWDAKLDFKDALNEAKRAFKAASEPGSAAQTAGP